MPNIFLISDTHFGHANILNFKRYDGTPLRVFDNVAHMDSAMIDNWNKVVKPEDKVYHLGDVAMDGKYLSHLGWCNGTKVLIKGNHDTAKLTKYQQYFKDVRAYHLLDNYALSHVPIHPESLSRWKGNFHGHLHANRVRMLPYKAQDHENPTQADNRGIDPKYYCVSVECIDYTPIEFTVARKLIEAQK